MYLPLVLVVGAMLASGRIVETDPCLFVAPCTTGSNVHELQDHQKDREDSSIVLAELWKTVNGREVENGTAYDKTQMDLEKHTKLVVPENVKIRTDGPAGKIQIFMAKTLAYAGHPPESMSIRQMRNQMGCAVKSENEILIVGPYGEWDSHIEGGASIKLIIVLPKGVTVEKRKGLPEEVRKSQDRVKRGRPGKKTEERETSPQFSKGWKALVSEPDPQRTAK